MVTTHPYIDEKFHCYNHFAVVGAIIYPFLPPPPGEGRGGLAPTFICYMVVI